MMSSWPTEVGIPIRGDAEIVHDREGESISWRSLPGSDLALESAVRFETAPGKRGTLVVYAPRNENFVLVGLVKQRP